MGKSANSIPYLDALGNDARNAGITSEIEAAIQARGFWEREEEWRISTVTVSRVESIQLRGETWYRVKVKCDAEMVAECPTIARAAEFVGVFEQLSKDLFWTLGWPGWVSYGKMT